MTKKPIEIQVYVDWLYSEGARAIQTCLMIEELMVSIDSSSWYMRILLRNKKKILMAKWGLLDRVSSHCGKEIIIAHDLVNNKKMTTIDLPEGHPSFSGDSYVHQLYVDLFGEVDAVQST